MRKESFAMERFKHRLASWNREFNLSMSKADAETFLAAASALLIQRRVAASSCDEVQAEDDLF